MYILYTKNQRSAPSGLYRERYVTFLRYHNVVTLSRSVIGFIIHSSGQIGAAIASNSYCLKLIDQRYCFYSSSLFRYASAFHFSDSLIKELYGDFFSR
jgi:hypothetical protein